MLAGCKVTLRDKNLQDFIDSLSITLPRMEKFQPAFLTKKEDNNIYLKLNELVLFYPIELGLGINSEVKKLDINFVTKTFSVEDKIFLLTSNKIPTH
jgi:ribosomal protein L5